MRARLDVSFRYSRSQNGISLFLRQNLKALILIGANFRDFFVPSFSKHGISNYSITVPGMMEGAECLEVSALKNLSSPARDRQGGSWFQSREGVALPKVSTEWVTVSLSLSFSVIPRCRMKKWPALLPPNAILTVSEILHKALWIPLPLKWAQY